MRSTRLWTIVLWVSSGTCLVCQTQQKAAPRFEEFPVTDTFHGTPAQPSLQGSGDRLFRTAIRDGARKGPNFAGHYTVVEWGCGSGCVVFVVVDAVSGRIYHVSPFDDLAIPYLGTEDGREFKGLEYRSNSALLVADGCPENDSDDSSQALKNCGTRYYKWERAHLVLILTVDALPKSR